MCINNILNMGFIEDKHFGLFKRKRCIENKLYSIEYYMNSTLQQSLRRTSTNQHKLVHTTGVSTDTSSVNIVMRILCKRA
jgi:hypothetical protein